MSLNSWLPQKQRCSFSVLPSSGFRVLFKVCAAQCTYMHVHASDDALSAILQAGARLNSTPCALHPAPCVSRPWQLSEISLLLFKMSMRAKVDDKDRLTRMMVEYLVRSMASMMSRCSPLAVTAMVAATLCSRNTSGGFDAVASTL